jgi:hypothetical protein
VSLTVAIVRTARTPLTVLLDALLGAASSTLPALGLSLLPLELELELATAALPTLLFTPPLDTALPFALCRKGVDALPTGGCPAAPCAAMAVHCSSVNMPSSLACFVQASRFAVGVEPDHSTLRISAKLRSS